MSETMALQLHLSKAEIWKKIKKGIWKEEDVIRNFSREELPSQLIKIWRERGGIHRQIQQEGLSEYAGQSKFDQLKNVQRLLNLLHYSYIPYQTQSVELTLRLGKANCLEGALVAAYCIELRGYQPQILTLTFEKQSHALCLVEDETGFLALHKRRRMVTEKLKKYSSVDNLISDYVNQYKQGGNVTQKWGLANLNELSINWHHGWKSRGGYIDNLERRLDGISLGMYV